MKNRAIHTQLDKELRINQGLLTGLRGAAQEFYAKPKDAEKAKEALAALQECRNRLEKLRLDTERILRSTKGITQHTAKAADRTSLFGMRGNLSGHTRKFLDEIDYHLGRTKAAIDLVKSMNSKPGETLKSALELIDDVSTAIKKWDGGAGNGHVGVPGWNAPSGPAPADPVQAASLALVLVATLISKWMDRKARTGK